MTGSNKRLQPKPVIKMINPNPIEIDREKGIVLQHRLQLDAGVGLSEDVVKYISM